MRDSSSQHFHDFTAHPVGSWRCANSDTVRRDGRGDEFTSALLAKCTQVRPEGQVITHVVGHVARHVGSDIGLSARREVNPGSTPSKENGVQRFGVKFSSLIPSVTFCSETKPSLVFETTRSISGLKNCQH